MSRCVVYQSGGFTNYGISYRKYSQEELAEMENRAMTENEAKAVRFIENIKNHAMVTLDHIVKEEPNVSPLVYKGREERANTILAMVEEVQQYRELGTIEELTAKNEELKRWHTDRIAENIKNSFANTSTLCCHNCDHKDDYIEELEAEVEEYEEIGTPEECRAAMEKQTAKKIEIFNGQASCPNCKHLFGGMDDIKKLMTWDMPYCKNCGQKLDWSDVE